MPHKTLVTRSLDAKASQLQPQIKGRWGLIVLRDFKHDADLPPRQSFFLWKKTIEPMQVCRSGRDPWEEKLMTLLRRVVWRIRRNLVACRTFALCYIACTRRIRRRELFLDCGWSVAVVPISKHHSVGFLPCMYSICGYVGIYANISVHIYKWYINIYYILYIYIKIRMCVCN